MEQLTAIKEFLMQLYKKGLIKNELAAVTSTIIQIDTVLSKLYQDHIGSQNIIEHICLPEDAWDKYSDKDKTSYGAILNDLKLVTFMPPNKLPLLVSYFDSMTNIGKSLFEFRLKG